MTNWSSKLFRYILSLLVTCVIVSCSSVDTAQFSMVNSQEGMTSYGCPVLIVTIENTSDVTGWNVGCYVHAMNAQGTIIDTGFAYFGYGGQISPGERIVDDAVFFKLLSFNSISTFKYDITWLTWD